MREYMNNCTYAIEDSLAKAILMIFKDMYHYPKCRTIKMFSISRVR